ncbi:hypothetical protein ES703_103171 [subsurface metagenome]
MKSFLRKRWHGLPVGIVTAILLVCLLTGSAIASTYIVEDQTITQTITEPPPDYGTITAIPIDLDDVIAGKSFSQTFDGAVVVELGPDGVGQEFRMSMTPSSLYTSLDVTITLVEKPVNSEVGMYGYGISDGGLVGIQLDVEGTYTFDQTISGTAGDTAEAASSTVHFTLETYTGPPPPP